MDAYQQWLDAKEAERAAIERRRELEDKMVAELNIAQAEGTKTIKDNGFVVKVTTRFNKRIDSDLLQEIARDEGLSEHLGSLFRWKPEINAAQWKSAAPEITKPLEAAITVTPGRPSFAITKED